MAHDVKSKDLTPILHSFRLIVVDSMEMIYRLILAGPQPSRPLPLEDSS